MRKYEIVDLQYFDKLPLFYKQNIIDLRDEMNVKGILISDVVGSSKRLNLDLVKMIKEGYIFSKFEKKFNEGRKQFRKILIRCFGIKEYYIRIRQDILKTDLRRIVNLYYSNAIQFFDIQQLVHFNPEMQKEVIDRLLIELDINDDRPKRFAFYAKYKRVYHKKKNKFLQGYYTYDNVIIPGQKEMDELHKKKQNVNLPNNDPDRNKHVILNPATTIQTVEENPKKFEILSIPVEAVAHADDFPTKKKKGTKIHDLQAKRIKELNNKIDEMRRLIVPPPKPVLIKKDVPKDELDYYNNHIDMVITPTQKPEDS